MKNTITPLGIEVQRKHLNERKETCKQLDQERSETKSAIDENGHETYLGRLLLNAVHNMD
jgi:hypothetical protein